jgi:hypothetical protein
MAEPLRPESFLLVKSRTSSPHPPITVRIHTTVYIQRIYLVKTIPAPFNPVLLMHGDLMS